MLTLIKKLKEAMIPIEVKIASVLAVGSIASIVIAFVGYYKLGLLHANLTQIADHTVAEINLGLKLNRAIIDVDRAEKNIILAYQPKDVEYFEKRLKDFRFEVTDTLTNLRQRVPSALLPKLDSIEKAFIEYSEIQSHIIDLIKIDLGLKSVEAPTKSTSNSFPSFSELQKLTMEYHERCTRKFGEDHRLKGAVCQLITDEINQYLATLRVARQNIVLSLEREVADSSDSQEISSTINQIYLRLDDLREILGPEDSESLDGFVRVLGQWLMHQAHIDFANKASNRPALAAYRERGRELSDQIRQLTNEIVAFNDQELERQKERSKKTYNDGSILLISLSALCIVLSLGFGFLVLSHVTSSLKKLTNMARRVAKGDLSARTDVHTRDQIGELSTSLNVMAQKISDFTEALKTSRRQAEAANRMKSQFLANMSHEIRTPMNGVLGMAELLSLTRLNKVQKRYVDRIRESGDILLALVNDILDFSKIEAGKLDLEHTEFDLFKTVEDVSAMLAYRAQTKSVELVCDIAPDTTRWIKGDPSRIRQIIMNLLSNAVKFTEKGEVWFQVRTMALLEEPNIVLSIQVQDTGIGIDAETFKHLFKPFTQADTSTTRNFGGTGLGLAITKKLVELMGGKIDVSSTAGKGSTFTVSVPLEIAAKEDGVFEPITNDGEQVLLVEGHQRTATVIEQHLRYFGFNVTVARTCADAIDSARKMSATDKEIAAILINQDFGMSQFMHCDDMSSFELAEALALVCKDKSPNPAIVFLTRIGIIKEEEGWNSSLPNCVQLAKPVRVDELYQVMNSMHYDSQIHASEYTSSPASSKKFGVAGGKVLVAEDNRINQDVAVGLLQKLGFAADIAVTGAQAVEQAKTNSYSLILMDCQMPEMDGYRAAHEIRKLRSPFKDVPIVAMTASAFRGDRERCLAAGMDDYIAKPVTLEKLEKVLRRWHGSNLEGRDVEDFSHGSVNANPLVVVKQDLSKSHSHLDELVGQLSSDLIDKQAVLQIMEIEQLSKPGFFKELAEVFFRSAEEHIEALGKSVSEKNFYQLQREAHFIKGSAGNFGAKKVVDICKKLELCAKAEDINDTEKLQSDLWSEYKTVKTELKRFIQATESL